MVRRGLVALTLILSAAGPLAAQQPDTARLSRFKQELAREIDRRARFTQQLVDQIFSYSELGFQETETSRFLTTLLRDSGFTVQEGIFGMPTAWVASWGQGRPVVYWAPTSTASRAPRSGPASPATARWFPAAPVTARGTTRAWR